MTVKKNIETHRKRSAAAVALLIAGLLAMTARQYAVPSEDHPTTAAVSDSAARYYDFSAGDDWPGYGRTFGEQHFSPLADIDADNVDHLKLAWFIDLEPGNSTTAPTAVDGVVYFVRGYSIVS